MLNEPQVLGGTLSTLTHLSTVMCLLSCHWLSELENVPQGQVSSCTVRSADPTVAPNTNSGLDNKIITGSNPLCGSHVLTKLLSL